jgi:hypothetical protein
MLRNKHACARCLVSLGLGFPISPHSLAKPGCFSLTRLNIDKAEAQG